MALKLSPASDALNVNTSQPVTGPERQFVVMPRGTDRVFLIRKVHELGVATPRVTGCPTFWAFTDEGGDVKFYPEPSEDYPVFELVAVR